MKYEASDTVKLQKDLNDSEQKCATQEDKLKEAKSKLKKQSQSYNIMLENNKSQNVRQNWKNTKNLTQSISKRDKKSEFRK